MRRIWTTAWSLSLAATSFPMVASAADFVPAGHRRPGWRYSEPCCPTCPDGAGAATPSPSGQQPTMPDGSVQPMPSDMNPSAQPPSPAPSSDAADLPSFSNVAFAEQGMGGGAGTMILGRADAVNRFNLFDNMSAEPVSRVWFAFQSLDGLNTNIVGAPVGSPDQNLYRFGVEYAFSQCTSIAAQFMYNDPLADRGVASGLEEDWSNPQFMVKQVLSRSDFMTISGTLGLSIETSTEPGTLNEQFSRLQPGLLVFQDLDNGWFVQGGGQIDIALDDNGTSNVGWAISLGNWLYRHSSLDGCGNGCSRGCGSCNTCQSNCCLPWVVGMTGQIELLGKHVVGDATIRDGFLLEEPDIFGPPGAFTLVGYDIEEARNVIDMTIGTNILFKNDTALGLGYSFPVSDDEVRKGEFILSYNWFL